MCNDTPIIQQFHSTVRVKFNLLNEIAINSNKVTHATFFLHYSKNVNQFKRDSQTYVKISNHMQLISVKSDSLLTVQLRITF